jgi:hypothetical protein
VLQIVLVSLWSPGTRTEAEIQDFLVVGGADAGV